MTHNTVRAAGLAAIALAPTLWLLLGPVVPMVLTSPDVQLRNLAAAALAGLVGTIALVMVWWAWRER